MPIRSKTDRRKAMLAPAPIFQTCAPLGRVSSKKRRRKQAAQRWSPKPPMSNWKAALRGRVESSRQHQARERLDISFRKGTRDFGGPAGMDFDVIVGEGDNLHCRLARTPMFRATLSPGRGS